MCSRYSRTKGQVKVGKAKVAIKAPPQAIIRPTDRASVIRKGAGGLEEANLRWGLIPSWAKDPKIGVQCINARAETISEKPSFREAFLKRRCLVPADGFWEWETIGKKKIPWKFTRPDGVEFCMAGLWEAWNSPEGILETFTIITTSPNELVRSVHDRMPVILSQDEGEVWLEAGRQDLLRSAPDEVLCIALGLFAGVRTEEIARMDWKDIRLSRRQDESVVEITKVVAKKRLHRRLIPILPPLRAYLQKFKPPTSGKISPVKTLSDRFEYLAKRVGIEWKHNGLRHSFGSYRLASLQNIHQLKEEMGNSEAMIRQHYQKTVTRAEATKFWAIRPI